ncbi:MAG: DUF4040 domain-containing protein [Motiliproteus sp.]|nr:DUF4040 domain-containing protein [Motiliproteus sp.]MCW9051602.1 DUF4040 domain-containing protein [Motiliproteus sp.]
MINVVLLGFMIMVAFAAIRMRDLFAVAMLSGIYSFLAAGLFMALDAVDVAFTEAAVGAGVTTVLFLSTLRCIDRFEVQEEHLIERRRWLPVVVVLITGGALVYGMSDAPLMGLADAPVHGHVSQRYIEQGPIEVGVANMVTAVLASYRGFDTLGETVVIFTAGLTVLLLLGFEDKPTQRLGRNASGHHLVLRVVTKILLPFILMFALYVQFHGDFGAGGGFQAGVIFATGFILYDLVFGSDDTRQVVPVRCLIWGACAGVLLYGGVGVTTALMGEAYLDYNVLGADPVAGQHIGIMLVEFGVGLTVFSVVLLIYEALAGRRCRPCQKP